jgi:hypothetical protein
MAHEIRLKVWLIGLPPILLVAGVAIWLVVSASDRKPAARRAPVATIDPVGAQPTNEPPPLPPPVPRAALPPPPATATVAAVVIPASASSALGPPPEPIPELAELRPPPESSSWTEDQKSDYRQKVLGDIAARERRLQREVAAAHRAGDTHAEQEKAATLAYLRAKRADVERLMSAAEKAQQAEQDARP